MRYSNYRKWFWGGFLCVLVGALNSPAANAELVAHFKLDDGGGTTAVDSGVTAPQLNGTLTGDAGGNGVFDTPDWVTGIDGGALQFGDATGGTKNDDVVEVANSGVGSKFDLNGTLTIAAWINLDDDSASSISSTRHIAGKDRAGGPTDDGFGINHTMGSGADLLRFMVSDDDVNTVLISSSTLTDLKAASVTAGNSGWVHVAGVYDPGSSMKLYINGILDVELTTGVPAEAESVPTPFNIGRLDNSSTHSFYGLIDDVQLYDEALTDSQVFALTGLGTAVPSLTVDRITGAMTLVNAAFASASLDIQGYSITSSSGALNASSANWKSITNNYDSNNDQTVDLNDEWTILTEPQENGTNDLSEFQFGGSPGDGGSIAAGESVTLSLGDGAWIPWFNEDDLEILVTLNDGSTINVPIVYEGNGGNPLLRSDLDGDGAISGVDWLTLASNFPSSTAELSALSVVQAYALGDIDLNGEIGVIDFQTFKSDYDLANGPGSFDAMLQSIPEPSSLLLLIICSLMIPRRRI